MAKIILKTSLPVPAVDSNLKAMNDDILDILIRPYIAFDQTEEAKTQGPACGPLSVVQMGDLWANVLNEFAEEMDQPEVVDFVNALQDSFSQCPEVDVVNGSYQEVRELTRSQILAVAEILSEIMDDDDEPVYTMMGEDGNEADYEQIFEACIGEKNFVLLVPVEDDGQEALILRKTLDEDNEELFIKPSEEEAGLIYELFNDSLDDVRPDMDE